MEKARIMDSKAVMRAVTRISHEIVEKNKGIENIFIVGIKTKGIPLAKMIAKKVSEIEGGNVISDFIDITRYRDDITHDKIRDTVDESFIRKVSLDKGIILEIPKLCQTSLLDTNIIIIVHIVQTNDLGIRLSGQDTFCQVGTDETGGTGDKDCFHCFLPLF